MQRFGAQAMPAFIKVDKLIALSDAGHRI